MPAKPIDVIVAGHLCLDLLPQMDHIRLNQLNTPGHLLETGPMHFSTGGAVSNTGLALHRLGVNVCLMSNVGGDLIGEMILAFLNHRDPQLARSIQVKPEQASSYTVVLSPEKLDRIFLHCTGTNETFHSTDVNYDLVKSATIFHLGYPPLLASLAANDGEDLALLFQRAKEAGAVTSLDLSLPDPSGASGKVNWEKLLIRTLPFVDVFVPSLEETLFMLRPQDYNRWRSSPLEHVTIKYLDTLIDQLLQMSSAAVVGFKLSEFGIYLSGAGADRLNRLNHLPLRPDEWCEKRIWHPAFKVNVAGTTGAGDAAYAGILSALLRGMSIEKTAQWACAVGACSVETTEATKGVLSWDATEERLKNGWELHHLKLPDVS